MKTSSIAVETSRSISQSDSIVRQTNNVHSLFYTTMNNIHIFNDNNHFITRIKQTQRRSKKIYYISRNPQLAQANEDGKLRFYSLVSWSLRFFLRLYRVLTSSKNLHTLNALRLNVQNGREATLMIVIFCNQLF